MNQNNGWYEFVQLQKKQPYFHKLTDKLLERKAAGAIVFPPETDVFKAYELVEPNQVKVVILGQDPYHGKGQAHGLSFSVKDGQRIPPSLRNMFKELASEYDDFVAPSNGNLTAWAEQGVLLLNATLTVEEANPNAHQKYGWQDFTDETIKYISEQCDGVVFMLWGAFAHKKEAIIDSDRHHILKSAHPSPLSARRGFFGNNHFKTANELLANQGKQPIVWHLP